MRLRRAAAAAVAGAILLGGCNDDKDTSSSPTTAASQAAAGSSGRQISGGPFCERVLTFTDRSSRIDPSVAEPQQLRRALEEATRAIEEAEQTAPAEIKTDVAVLASQFRDLVLILDQAGFDFTKIPPASLGRLQSPEIQSATQRVNTYVGQNCRTS